MPARNTLLPWSYTKLSTYEKCPAQAKYRYLDRLEAPRSPQASRGSDIHSSIEWFLLGKSKKVHEAVAAFQHVFEDLLERNAETEFKLGVTKDWKSMSFKDAYGRAVIDSVVKEKDHIDAQEWKSGKEYDDHTDQRHLYLTFLRVNWPKAHRYKISTYYLDLGKKKTLELEHAELDEVQREFSTRVAIMASDDILAARPGFYCGWCPYAKQKGGPCKHG